MRKKVIFLCLFIFAMCAIDILGIAKMMSLANSNFWVAIGFLGVIWNVILVGTIVIVTANKMEG